MQEIKNRARCQVLGARGGFTLVELLIVISVIGVLSSLTVFTNISKNLQRSRDGRRQLMWKPSGRPWRFTEAIKVVTQIVLLDYLDI